MLCDPLDLYLVTPVEVTGLTCYVISSIYVELCHGLYLNYAGKFVFKSLNLMTGIVTLHFVWLEGNWGKGKWGAEHSSLPISGDVIFHLFLSPILNDPLKWTWLTMIYVKFIKIEGLDGKIIKGRFRSCIGLIVHRVLQNNLLDINKVIRASLFNGLCFWELVFDINYRSENLYDFWTCRFSCPWQNLFSSMPATFSINSLLPCHQSHWTVPNMLVEKGHIYT